MAAVGKSPFDLSTCARANILTLQPYRCARDDYKDDGKNVLLDANENAIGPGLVLDSNGKMSTGAVNGATNGETYAAKDVEASSELDLRGLNRYPDPHQIELKTHLCALRQSPNAANPLTPEHLFVGVGSDEAIDNLFRAFCRPGLDKILTCPPTYGMYTVSAHVNDIAVDTVPLDAANDFALDVRAVSARLAADASLPASAGRIKLLYLCSPGNPTGALLPPSAIEQLLAHPTYNGLVVVDEAYVDFSPDGTSLAPWVARHPNLVVMQTLSKAFGLAGLRVGAAFAAPPVARLLNNLKAPYNVSELSSRLAARALAAPPHRAHMLANRDRLLAQRARLRDELPRVPGVGRFRGGFDANFLLVEMLDGDGAAARPSNDVAMLVYERLAQSRGVVVRFRGKEHGCTGCLRVTVGTEAEVDRFLRELRAVLRDAFAAGAGGSSSKSAEEAKEQRANGTIP